jgi:hypothetical protein
MAAADLLASMRGIGSWLPATSDFRAHRVCRPILTKESDVVGSHQVGRREGQVLDVVDRPREASLAVAGRAIAFPPIRSPFGAMPLLRTKNPVNDRSECCQDRPVTSRISVGRRAPRELVRNIFHGRPAVAVAAPQDGSVSRLEPEDVERIKRRIENAEERS